MKINILLVVMVCSINYLYSQSKIDQIGLSYISEATFLTSQNSTIEDETGQDIGHTFQINLEKKKSAKWSIIAGIGFAQRTYKYFGKKGGYLTVSDLTSPTGTGGSRLEAETTLNTIEISAASRYYIWTDGVFLTPGISLEYLISSNHQGTFTEGSGNENELKEVSFNNRRLNVGGNLSIGYFQPITNKFALSFSAHSRISILRNELYLYNTKSHYYSFGLSLGVQYKLNT